MPYVSIWAADVFNNFQIVCLKATIFNSSLSMKTCLNLFPRTAAKIDTHPMRDSYFWVISGILTPNFSGVRYVPWRKQYV
jgi:hypothetical protein